MGYPYKKKEETFTQRKDFDKFKVIHKLKKARSPMIIEFLSEPNEDWFVEVIRYKRTNQLIVQHSLICLNQVDDWVERNIRINGYEKVQE